MNFRMADSRDVYSLAEMRWLHEYEEDKVTMSKEEFVDACIPFLKEGLERGTWAYWIAEDNGEIVANIYINRIRKVPKPQNLYGEIGYVTNVHTKESYRNTGVGKELLTQTIAWAKEEGLELLFVWPSERAVNFYSREGFNIKNEIMELILNEE